MKNVKKADFASGEVRDYEPTSVTELLQTSLDKSKDDKYCLFRADEALVIYSYTAPDGTYQYVVDATNMKRSDVLWMLENAKLKILGVQDA